MGHLRAPEYGKDLMTIPDSASDIPLFERFPYVDQSLVRLQLGLRDPIQVGALLTPRIYVTKQDMKTTGARYG